MSAPDSYRIGPYELQPEPGLGMPRDVSADGWRIDRLVDMSLVVIAVLFTIKVAWMLWACFAHGRRHAARFDRGDSRRWVGLKLGIASFIFLVVDGNLFVNSTADLEHIFWNWKEADADPEAVRIEILGRQWAWQARYAGQDGSWGTADDVVTTNDVRVPVDRTVSIQIGAVDVLHSLYIPNLRVKQDAVPGDITRARFRAREVGAYEIACAQHCGAHHYKMRGVLTVLPQDEFAAWMDSAGERALLAAEPQDIGASWAWPWEVAP